MRPFVCCLGVVILRKDRFEESDPFILFRILFDPHPSNQAGENHYLHYLMLGKTWEIINWALHINTKIFCRMETVFDLRVSL